MRGLWRCSEAWATRKVCKVLSLLERLRAGLIAGNNYLKGSKKKKKERLRKAKVVIRKNFSLGVSFAVLHSVKLCG